ncbi:MAG: hypothetical protein ABJH04_04630 [Cyclobacteriaceae bacterium]
MKLLKSQHKDILQLLDELKIPQERLLLVKKKGRIQLTLSGVDTYFDFFRRKAVSITSDEHQWKEVEHYELKIAGKPQKVSSWADVVLELRKWLHGQTSTF